MSSTEPPSRSGPRNQAQDNKVLRDELSSKGRVEKIRAVDADEETRKNQFLKYYKDDLTEDEQAKKAPSPIDLYSSQGSNDPSLGGAEEAIVPSPSYSSPPDVNTPLSMPNDTPTMGALPRSDEFWDDFSLPDDPRAAPTLQEKTPPPPQQGAQNKKKGSKDEEKEKEPSPFGPPGKLVPKMAAEKPAPQQKKEEKRPSPFEPPPQKPQARPLQKEEEKSIGGPLREPVKMGKRAPNRSVREEDSVPQGPGSLSFKSEDREEKKGDSQKTVAVERVFEPAFPAAIQPVAVAATTQAAPYLSPSTMNLFFQMVGTMYIMAGPQGISRTEILLNNPAFTNSRFFGSIITIEKYATAPDSFNIRLTGSNQQAVVSFKENIPSLMNAFQNGNFSFRVNRIDVEYTNERPVFRRKEKGEGRGETGGGDLRERRK